MLSDDFALVVHIANEAKTAHDVDRFILALADQLVMLLKRAVELPLGTGEVTADPLVFVEDRIRWFLDQAEQAGQ